MATKTFLPLIQAISVVDPEKLFYGWSKAVSPHKKDLERFRSFHEMQHPTEAMYFLYIALKTLKGETLSSQDFVNDLKLSYADWEWLHPMIERWCNKGHVFAKKKLDCYYEDIKIDNRWLKHLITGVKPKEEKVDDQLLLITTSQQWLTGLQNGLLDVANVRAHWQDWMLAHPSAPIVQKCGQEWELDLDYGVLLMMLVAQRMQKQSGIVIESLAHFMGNNDQERMVWRSKLFKSDGVLQRLSLATMGDSMDIFGMTELVAGDEVMRVFYPEVDWSFKPVVGQEDVGRLMAWDSIVEEKLFYNEADREQLEGIGKMMEDKSFDRIIKQLKQRRLGTGMPIMLYGPPGTGKTASVMQWGRMNQRSIFLVDISEIRGKYMGDTEKNAKRIFQRYRQLVKSEKRCPILLFNEADGVLSKRIGVERSVDMANNALQNILLQELENFEGILVATTNLLDNLDAAFERRFLWKVALNQPDQEVQLAMMQHVLSGDMKSQDIVSIGLKYKLTGGQISNIYRKFVLDIVMHPKKNKPALLDQLCEKESQYAQREGRGKIGF